MLSVTLSYLTSQLFINNEWHESCSSRKIPVYNPATGKLLCEVEEADAVGIAYVMTLQEKPCDIRNKLFCVGSL